MENTIRTVSSCCCWGVRVCPSSPWTCRVDSTGRRGIGAGKRPVPAFCAQNQRGRLGEKLFQAGKLFRVVGGILRAAGGSGTGRSPPAHQQDSAGRDLFRLLESLLGVIANSVLDFGVPSVPKALSWFQSTGAVPGFICYKHLGHRVGRGGVSAAGKPVPAGP